MILMMIKRTVKDRLKTKINNKINKQKELRKINKFNFLKLFVINQKHFWKWMELMVLLYNGDGWHLKLKKFNEHKKNDLSINYIWN